MVWVEHLYKATSRVPLRRDLSYRNSARRNDPGIGTSNPIRWSHLRSDSSCSVLTSETQMPEVNDFVYPCSFCLKQSHPFGAAVVIWEHKHGRAVRGKNVVANKQGRGQ